MFFQHSHRSPSDPLRRLLFTVDLHQAIANVVYGVMAVIFLMNPESCEKKKIKFAKKNTDFLTWPGMRIPESYGITEKMNTLMAYINSAWKE